MTADEVYTGLYTWIDQVVNTEPSQSIEIIQSHQNAPEPTVDGKYIVIDYAPTRSRVGRPSATNVDTGTLKRELVNDDELLVELWEVNGNGDELRRIRGSTDRQDIIDLLKSLGLIFWGDEGINVLPRTQENRWVREVIMEIRLRIADAVEEESSYIENAEYTGTVPAQGRSGDHTITNT